MQPQSSLAAPVVVVRDDRGLDRLLAECRTFSCEFPEYLANHLPMVLVALQRLGASDARLAAYFETYRDVKGLVAAPPPMAPITRSNWREFIGDRSRESDYRVFFTGEARRLGAESMAHTYLLEFVAGIAASALHSLMRLAYGALRSDPEEIAAAVGYLASTSLILGRASGAEPLTDDPGAVLMRMRDISALRGIEPPSHLLWHHMQAVSERPEFSPVVDWLAVTPATLTRLASASLALFAATMDFCALHAVTGTHWVRMTAPLAPDLRPVMRYFWQAIAALYPRMGFPPLPSEDELSSWRRIAVPDWPAIKSAAIESDDEHDHSLVFSAFEEWKVYRDPLYRLVAARRVGLA